MTFEVPEFQDDDYKVWKERVLYLGMLDIDYAIRKDKPLLLDDNVSEKQAKLYEHWERSNRICVMFIKTKLSTNFRGLVEKIENVRELLKVLDEQFTTSDMALAKHLILQFASARLAGVRGVGDHVMHVRDIANQLRSLEFEISNAFLVEYILSTLPSQYDPYKIAYNTRKEKWTLNELMTMCVQEERRLFVVKDKDMKVGHVAEKENVKDRSLARTLILQFSSARLAGVRGVRDHIMHIRDIANQLKALEFNMSDTFLVYYILSTLPSQYDPYKIAYNIRKEKWSLHKLVTMCVQEESRLLMENKDMIVCHVEEKAKAKKTYPTKKKDKVCTSTSMSILPHKDIRKVRHSEKRCQKFLT